MKKILILVSVFIMQTIMSFSQTPATDPGWELYFDDEFNSGTVPNPDYWDVKNDFNQYGQQVVYLTANTYVQNGNLILQMENIPYHCTNLGSNNCNQSDYNFRSGYVHSQFSFPYGYIEARIKCDHQLGETPAFWTT